uniref:Odorant binding protein 16 n=1 Tax=Sirex nitobei TaxID=1602346 RepID=A0A857NDF1_9HYME|nr:odorant binding protein 16 [Sirex nitobei]
MDGTISLGIIGVLLLLLNVNAIDRPIFITERMLQAARPMKEICYELANVSEEEVNEASNGNFIAGNNIGCYTHCIWERMGLLDEFDNVKTNVLENLLPEDVKNEIISTLIVCQRQNPAMSDKCSRTLAILKCYCSLSPKTYYLM